MLKEKILDLAETVEEVSGDNHRGTWDSAEVLADDLDSIIMLAKIAKNLADHANYAEDLTQETFQFINHLE